MSEGAPANPLVGFRDGVRLLPEAVGLLRRHRRLWLLASVPVLLTSLLLAASAIAFATHLASIHAALTGWMPALEAGAWWTWAWIGPGRALLWLLGWLVVAVAFVLALVVSLLLANLASAPLLDQLSQRVERVVTGGASVGASDVTGMVAETLRSFRAELGRIAFLGGVWLVLSVAGLLLPGVQLLSAPLLVGVTTLFLPLDYSGFALDRRQVRFGARRRWLFSNWSLMAGFGGVGLLVSGVPGLNLFVLPVMVTAGTLLVLRRPPVTT